MRSTSADSSWPGAPATGSPSEPEGAAGPDDGRNPDDPVDRPVAAPPSSPRLDARYGRSPNRRRRRGVIAIVTAASFVVVFAAWVVFAAFDGTGSKLETSDLGYVVTDARDIDVRYSVSVEPGTAVSCAVQAQNTTFAIVGWKVVHLPAATQRSTTYTTSLKTSERAVTGLIYRCWLP